jgi:hypothetical protein
LALTPDGRRAISTSDEIALAAWDVTSRSRSLLVRHQDGDGFVSVIAAAPGGDASIWRI